MRLEKIDGKWIERASKPHHGSGRKRRKGFTKDGERQIRPCMRKRKRPQKGGKNREKSPKS